MYLMILHSAQVQPKAKSKFPAKLWSETFAASQIPDINSVGFSVGIDWCPGIYCIARSGNKCKSGSWVFIRSSTVSPRLRIITPGTKLIAAPTE